MKKKFFALPLILSAFIATAQRNTPKEDYYIFKSDWQPASKSEDAAYFARSLRISDTCWQWDIYNYLGPMIASLQYKDEKQTQLHGRQHYFKPTGYLDSAGVFVNGVKHGDWSVCNDTGRVVTVQTYDMGTLTKVTDALKANDSLKNRKSDRDEQESSFPGGLKKWQQYLIKNMRYPDRALKAAVMGDVVVQFIVDTNGIVSNVDIVKSVEFSLDEETIRLIRKSPRWVAAKQDGRLVKSYKRQPLQYRFQ